ncbi:probable terpene synthase 11 isoform X3 [Helianthus annuus]|uniref:probable terpene synthase 11 isoform X3 n=1 Tax=Helianthus annuus TaxID=4232 RepID=UPI000B9089D7|nr:probable terpene synthase 11 isoform X3 [Helianthus annuus]
MPYLMFHTTYYINHIQLKRNKGMASQAYITSIFSHKVLYQRQLIIIPPFKGSKNCRSIFSSAQACPNTITSATEELIDTLSPLSMTDTVSYSGDRNSLILDHYGMMVIPPHDVNNRIEELKEYTRRALMNTSDSTMTLKLIDTIQRLGVGYYYEEEEIRKILKKLTHVLPKDDLYTVALHFRLQRHYGLHTNPAGLKLPRHMRMERLEARRYIEEYGNEDDHNPFVLEFAKYDYNKVQSVFQRELVEVNRWWEHLGLSSKLGFVRDRHVECFLWTVGLLPEPSFSGSRIELAKTIAIMLVIDDIYDTYGSYDDLVLFTEAIKRWDLNAIEQLPEYMKICYQALYNTNNEICDKIKKERCLSVQPFLRKTWIDMAEAYMVEAEWVKRGRIPTLNDYIENGVTTSGTYMALVHLFFLISYGLTTENMKHLLDPYPKFFTMAGTILRLWDDLGTIKEEQERGDMLSSIHLLMKEENITCEEEGREGILQMIYALWNDLNVELLTPDAVLFRMIKVALNMSRTSQVVYQHNDDSYLLSVKDHVQSLFYEPVDI